jgi:hypothetical protein
MQTDPIGQAGGMNIYAYVGGDPVNMVDPSGLTSEPLPPCQGLVDGCGDTVTVTGSRFTRQRVIYYYLVFRYLPGSYIGSGDGSGGGGNGGGGSNGTSKSDDSRQNCVTPGTPENDAINAAARGIGNASATARAAGSRFLAGPLASVVTRGGFWGGSDYSFSSPERLVPYNPFHAETVNNRSGGDSWALSLTRGAADNVALVIGHSSGNTLTIAGMARPDPGVDRNFYAQTWLDKAKGSISSGGWGVETVYTINRDGSCTAN